MDLKHIAEELRNHAPFTALGSLTGIILMAAVILTGISTTTSDEIFHVLHPVHILLSALVTTAMYRLYRGRIAAAVVIGFVGSVGICTISDIVFPYIGGALLGAPMSFHLCFLEHPWLVIPSAFMGIGIGLALPRTKVPHAGHILVSTYASLFYFTAFGGSTNYWLPLLPLIFLILFVAVWIPCCVSDIVFPLLFVKKGTKKR